MQALSFSASLGQRVTAQSTAAPARRSAAPVSVTAKQVLEGKVVSTSSAKTAVVMVSRKVPHPKYICLLYTSPSPRDATLSRMPSSA